MKDFSINYVLMQFVMGKCILEWELIISIRISV